MGSERGLYKPPGRKNWYYDFTVNKKRYQKSTGTTNKSRAREIRELKKMEILRNGGPIEHKDMSLKELIVDYLKAHQYKKSFSNDIKYCEIILSYYGDKPINILQNDKASVIDFRKKRAANKIKCRYRIDQETFEITSCNHRDRKFKKVGETTVNRYIKTLKRMYNYAIEQDYCIKNPTNQKGAINNRAEEEAKRTEFLEVDELNRYLDACPCHYYPVALIALHTGLRHSEVLELKWKDINLRKGFITIVGKGGRKDTVYLSSAALKMLKKMKRKSKDKFVFRHSRGNRYGGGYKDTRKAHEKALENSGIAEERRKEGKPTLTFHDLRHTFLSHLAMSSKNYKIVQQAGRHKDNKTTMRYVHLIDGSLKDEIEKMSQAISPDVT